MTEELSTELNNLFMEVGVELQDGVHVFKEENYWEVLYSNNGKVLYARRGTFLLTTLIRTLPAIFNWVKTQIKILLTIYDFRV